jgi:hypothetical protein
VRRPGKAVAEVAAWWVVLFLAYAVTLSAPTGPELAGAVVASAICAVLAVAARRAAGSSWRVRFRPPRGRLPLAIAADTVRLLIRSGHASIRTIEPAPDAAGGAWGTFLMSASPGTVVLDWPADGSPVVLHTLGDGKPRLDEVVTR